MTPGELAALIRSAGRVAALTGAGISTAAGVPDFRGPGGLYTTGKYDHRKTFTAEGFRDDPAHFFRFAREVLDASGDLEPTFTHRFLAELERDGALEGVVTQNIDPLHQEAGSRNVICVHGSFASGHCTACGREYGFEEMVAEIRSRPVPHCTCDRVGVIKPDVVLFGEMVKGLDRAADLAAGCDLLLILGSSLTVHPAAGLPGLCTGRVVVVNKGPVGLLPGPGRHVVDAELDPYFRLVAEAL
ncbi:MAG: SIR2 family NAD-dependent protein deacylase [Planctomycetota bacterium]